MTFVDIALKYACAKYIMRIFLSHTGNGDQSAEITLAQHCITSELGSGSAQAEKMSISPEVRLLTTS